MRELTVLAVLAVLATVGTATAGVTLSGVDATWTTLDGGDPDTYSGVGAGEVRWGIPDPAENETERSGLRAERLADLPVTFDCGEPFQILTLTHFNNYNGTISPDEVTLALSLTFDTPTGLTVDVEGLFTVDETRNIPDDVDDIITFPDLGDTASTIFEDVKYTFTFVGFGDDADTLIDEFVSPEGQDNVTRLWGIVTCTPIPAPGAILLGAAGTGLVGWLRRRRTL